MSFPRSCIFNDNRNGKVERIDNSVPRGNSFPLGNTLGMAPPLRRSILSGSAGVQTTSKEQSNQIYCALYDLLEFRSPSVTPIGCGTGAGIQATAMADHNNAMVDRGYMVETTPEEGVEKLMNTSGGRATPLHGQRTAE